MARSRKPVISFHGKSIDAFVPAETRFVISPMSMSCSITALWVFSSFPKSRASRPLVKDRIFLMESAMRSRYRVSLFIDQLQVPLDVRLEIRCAFFCNDIHRTFQYFFHSLDEPHILDHADGFSEAHQEIDVAFFPRLASRHRSKY